VQGVCIYCGAQGDMSSEHYLPDALGVFGVFQTLEGKVCGGCNTAIGNAAETQFLRTGPIGFFRWVLGIEGTNGQPPAPFYKRAGGAPPILVYGRAPGVDYDLLWEIEWATRNIFQARQIVFEDAVLGKLPLLVTDRMLNDRTTLLPALAERGIPAARPILAFGDPLEIPQIEAILQHNYGQLPVGGWQQTPALAGDQIALTTVVQVGQPFFRAVAKIVFHYALKVFPDLDGAHASFQPIRNYIRQGMGDGFVRELPGQVVGNFRWGERPRQWSHLLYVERNYAWVVGYAQFFLGPESLPFPLEVRIGGNPARIMTPTRRRGHGFVIGTIQGGGRPHGAVEDLQIAERVVIRY
jgi:hypothetical protein